MKLVAAIYHVAFESLGRFASLFEETGYRVHYVDATGAFDINWLLRADIVVILGGPIGVYQDKDYPFLTAEVDLARRRLLAGLPVLGICLGAQIMAKALGAKVYPGQNGKELGWSGLQLTEAGYNHPLSIFGKKQIEVLHWHGDTFDLPYEATLLASSSRYVNQAFSFGYHGLALQFHSEVEAVDLERWYVGHVAELSCAGIDVGEFRQQGIVNTQHLADAARYSMLEWIKQVTVFNH
ncbi:MAG: glutamine amidotransferase [Pseudomonadota bacterium]|nr:glutamine amidotransferase [Pseudomonadota bacterium]